MSFLSKFRFFVIISPLCENIDSAKADVAGIARYCLANIARIGYLLQLNFQYLRGLFY